MPDPTVTCADCGYHLDDLAEGAPCPSCGSIKRTHHRYFHDQVTATDSMSWQQEYGERKWQEQWLRLVRIHDDLAAIYSGSRLWQSTDEWRDITRQFFVVCHHLADWLAKDEALPVAARDDVWGYSENDPELALARDFPTPTNIAPGAAQQTAPFSSRASQAETRALASRSHGRFWVSVRVPETHSNWRTGVYVAGDGS